MKKNFALLFLTVFSIGFLPGCNNNNNPEVVSTSVEIKKQLNVTQFPTTEYFQYDYLDFSGLEVSELTYTDGKLTNTQVITDYTLTDSDGKTIQDHTQLLNSSEDPFEVFVNKDGCTSTSFTYYVDPISNFNQSLSVDSYPTKTMYQINDTFDATGLTVSLTTSYRADKTRKLSEVITDYTLSINNSTDLDNYTFSKVGVYTVNVSYKGWKSTLKASFSVTVMDSLELEDYGTEEDETISWTTNSEKMDVTFTNEEKEAVEGDKGYYSPDEVENKYNISTYAYNNAYLWHYTPSIGNVPLLVIPVVTPGDESKATSSNWKLIKKAFFGDSSDLYFESLRSYYTQSSFGKLNLTGTITGYFDVSQYSSKLSDLSNYTETNIIELAKLATAWAENTYDIDLTKYDSDQDGTVDGVWLINLHECNSYSNFWAFTTSTEEEGSVEEPVVNTFGWAGLDFLNDTYVDGGNYKNKACDAHVLIHETGHMFGLNDLYSYSYGEYDAVGKQDMMSYNVGDMSPYEKMMLGWITPYIVYGNNATISLESCQSKDNAIVIPYDDKTYADKDGDGLIDFNFYDEYLLLDYYTPDNLNGSDYDCYQMTHLSGKGGRLYHVDSRLASYDMLGAKATLYADPDDAFNAEDQDKNLLLAISNSESGTRSESQTWGWDSSCNSWDEIRWISADKKKLNATNTTSTSSLFKSGSSFDIYTYEKQFNKTAWDDDKGIYFYFDNEKDFNTSFKINSIK